MHCQRIASSRAVSTSAAAGRLAPVRGAAPHCRRNDVRVAVSGSAGVEKALFGEDFGARDPYAAEIESNFGEKVLGNWNTDHIIKPPDAIGKVIGLAARAIPAELTALDASTRERLRQQVPGWRMVTTTDGVQAIQQEWTVKDADCAQRLVDSVNALAAEQGHAPAKVEVVGGTTVLAQLSTKAVGDLTEADFIIAAKINSLDLSNLLQKRRQRFWA